MLLPFIQLHPSDLRKSRLRHLCGGGGFPPTFVQVHNEHSGPAVRPYNQLTRNEFFGSGGGWSRSTRSFEFSNNLNKLNRCIGEIREKAGVQVQNRYSGRHGPRSTKPSEKYITQEVRRLARCGPVHVLVCSTPGSPSQSRTTRIRSLWARSLICGRSHKQAISGAGQKVLHHERPEHRGAHRGCHPK
jgi:hypothetical protein